jgi:Zn-dependent M16 (insulinase) family peptidase
VHRSLVTVVPDPELNEREAAAERAELDARQAAMGEAEQVELRRLQTELEKFQTTPDSPEALASIPFLGEADIPRDVPLIPIEDRVLILGEPGQPVCCGGSADFSGQTVVPVKAHDLWTNGVSYIDLCFDLEHLTMEELRWMPLFAAVVPALGLPGLGYEATATRLNLLTGGFSAFTETSFQARASEDEPEDLSVKLFFRMRMLDSGIEAAVELAGRLIASADLSDTKRLQDLYLEMRNEYRAAVVPSGSSFAALRAERGLSASETIEELWRGVSQLEFLNALDEDESASAAERISAALQALRGRVVRREGLSANLTAEGKVLTDCLEAVRAWAEGLPSLEIGEEAFELADGLAADGTPVPRLEALTLPSKVAFVATALPGSLIGAPRYSHESLLAHLLRTGQLWEHIRMKGGAYGASAGNDGMSGLFTFSSYRDPRISATLAVYRQALEHFAAHPVEPGELLLAKIGSVAKEIRPLVPGEAGLVSFRRWLYGINDTLRQAKRDELLAATPADLAAAAANLLSGMEKSYSALIAGPDMVDKEEGANRDFRPVRKPLSV